MNDYNNFIKNNSDFQPRLIVEIAGEDVSHLLVEDHSVTTDAVLDTPTFNIYTTAVARFCLDNSNNQFNVKESPNFFTALDLPASGWQATVKISVVFENEGAPDDPRVMFVGYIEEITELPGSRWVSLLVLDKSGLLQHRVVEDFGRVVRANISGIDAGTNYTDAFPVFNLPANSTPVSRNSFSAGIYNGPILKVLPSLPLSGEYASYLYAGFDENTGELLLGAKPPDGATTILSVGYKAAYGYRTPEALVFLLLEASGVLDDLTDDEKIFAKSLIVSPELEHTRPQWSSHGRPQVGDTASDTPVVRWIGSSDSVFYHGGNRKLFKYERRNDAAGILDEYDLLSECPDTDASILQFVIEGSDFYVLTVNTFDGVSAKLWKVVDGETWGEIAGANATASHFYDYITQRDMVADNRKNFVVHSGWLYFVSARGVRRYQLSSGTLETVYSQGVTTEYSWDFAIHSGSLYCFGTQRPAMMDTHFKIYQMGLDGSGATELYTETFEREKRFEPACVSDIVVRGSNFYFVLTYSRRESRVGFSELCRMNVSGANRRVLKLYENALFSGRSLVVHREDSVDNIYFVEGTWISRFSDVDDYPTAEDSGHLIKIDTADRLIDLGLVWQSFRSVDGRGQHTAFASNLWSDSDSDTLHCVAGYGLLADALSDSIESLGIGEVASPGNWVWLQYGKQLSVKVPIFPTNDRTVWSLLEELAWTVDFEVGFTSGQDEIVLFNETYSSLVLESKGYLFFRARSPRSSSVRLDESDVVNVESTLDTTLVFNYISVPFGSGAPWISKDDGLIESDGVLWHPVRTRLLQNESFAWAEVIGDAVLERQKELRLKTRVPLKFSPHLELGQRIELTSEYHSLDSVPYKLTQVQHDVNLWQTEIEAREDFTVIELLTLPHIPDYHFVVGDSVSEVLPGASGGVSPYTYELLDTPSWVSFTTGTLTFSGTAVEGEWLLFYRVSDSSGRVAERTFRVRVSPAVSVSLLSFGGATIEIPEAIVGIEIEPVQLPTAMGGSFPLQYDLSDLPAGYEFDRETLLLTGIPEEAGTTAATYTATDSATPVNTADLEAEIVIVEPEGDGILEWDRIPPLSVFVDEDGNFSGSILDSVDDYLNNPSGADIVYSIASKSSVINSATLDATTNDLSVSITSVVGNSLNNVVTVRAEGMVDGVDRTVDRKINIDLIFQSSVDLEDYVTTGDISDFVTGGVTDGLATDEDLVAATDGLLTSGDIEDFVTADITNGLLTSGDIEDFVTADITNGLLTSGDIEDFVTADITNGLLTSGDIPDIPDTSEFITLGDLPDHHDIPDLSGYLTVGDIPVIPDLSGYLTVGDIPVIPDTSGFITEGATDGLASDADLVAATDGLVSDADLVAATDGLVSDADLMAATDGLASDEDLVAATDGVVTASDLIAATDGVVTASDLIAATDGVVTDGDLISATAGSVTGSDLIAATDGLASGSDLIAATDGLASDSDLIAATDGVVTDGELIAATDGVVTDGELIAATDGLVNDTDLTNATSGLASDSDLTNATSGLASDTDLTNATDGLANDTDLTNATDGLVNDTDLTNATSGLASDTDLTNATSGLASDSELQSATSGFVAEAYVDNATSGLATDGDLTSATSGLASDADLTSATLGLASDADLTSATSGLASDSDLNGLATDADLQSATSGLATDSELASATSGLATDAELAAAVNGLATDADLTSATSGLATQTYVNTATSNLATDAELTAATSGLATDADLNGLATDADLQSATSGLATDSELANATSGLATDSELASATSGLASDSDLNGLATDADLTSATSGLATDADLQSATSGLATDSELASATSGFATQAYVNSATSGLATDSDLNGLASNADLVSATSGLATDSELQSATSGLASDSDLNGLATDAELQSATSGLATDSELQSATSGFATQAYVNNATSGLASDSDLNGLASNADLQSATSGLATDSELASATSGFATQAYVNSATSGLASDSDLNGLATDAELA